MYKLPLNVNVLFPKMDYYTFVNDKYAGDKAVKVRLKCVLAADIEQSLNFWKYSKITRMWLSLDFPYTVLIYLHEWLSLQFIFFINMISVNLKLTHLCTRWTYGVHNTVKVILHMGVQCEVGVQNCVSAQRVFNYDLTLLNVR